VLRSLDPTARQLFEIEALGAQTLIDQGRFHDAEAHISKARRYATAAHELDEILLLDAQRMARMSASRRALRGALSVLRRSDNADHRARAHWVAGVALYRAGHYRWARESFELASAHYRISNNRAKLAQVLENLALVLKNQGRTAAALECLNQAIEMYPKKGYWRLRSYCHLHRGICFLRIGQIQDARVSLLEAKRLATRAEQVPVYIAAQNHLGHIFRMEGNYSTAAEFHRDALQAARSIGADRKVALALEFLGETSSEQGKYTEALGMLDEALDIATALGNRGDLLMEILRRRGEALIALGRVDVGTNDLRRALALCNARGEIREGLLVERSLVLTARDAANETNARAQRILDGLSRVGDVFEFSRSTCLLSEDHRFATDNPAWLREAQVAATHYFSAMGLRSWAERLQRVVGHGMPVHGGAPRGDRSKAPETLVTNSPRFADALDAARLAARSDDPALILGETGVGKEVIAQFIHRTSGRASRPLIAINCGAIPANLIESELFGHARGAFTGADRDRAGLFETADGGTVLLDEIGDLPSDVQVKLLRFLDHYEFHRIGEHHSRSADVRIIAATHKDMTRLVEQGVFRQDLFFRLNVFVVEVPPLRDRREDIPAMVDRFLGVSPAGNLTLRPSADLLRWMEAHAWRGNVRELRNLCRYLAVRCWGKDVIEPRDLPPKMRESCLEFLSGAQLPLFERERVDLERTQLIRALQQTRGSITAAGKLLGLHRNVVARRMRDHGLERTAFRGQ